MSVSYIHSVRICVVFDVIENLPWKSTLKSPNLLSLVPQINEGKRPKMMDEDEEWKSELNNLIRVMWSTSPSARPNMSTVASRIKHIYELFDAQSQYQTTQHVSRQSIYTTFIHTHIYVYHLCCLCPEHKTTETQSKRQDSQRERNSKSGGASTVQTRGQYDSTIHVIY